MPFELDFEQTRRLLQKLVGRLIELELVLEPQIEYLTEKELVVENKDEKNEAVELDFDF